MGTIDIIIICCFLPSLYFGARNGFIKQIISLLIIFFGIRLALVFSPDVAEWFQKQTPLQPFWIAVISFSLVFLVVALLLSLAGKLLDKIIRITMLGWLNVLLGIVFSMLKVALVLSLVVYAVNAANELTGFISEEKLAESGFFPMLLDFSKTVFPALQSIIQQQPLPDVPAIVA